LICMDLWKRGEKRDGRVFKSEVGAACIAVSMVHSSESFDTVGKGIWGGEIWRLDVGGLEKAPDIEFV